MGDTSQITLKEIQKIILEIMIDIDKFCRANGIRYSLCYGTLLGAVRHKGFIPWDDDADLFMPREDFDRFIRTYHSDRFKVIYNFDPEQPQIAAGYAKVGDTHTKAEDYSGMLTYGAWVDVFPVEDVPTDPALCRKFLHSLRSVDNRLYHRGRHDLNSIIKAHRHPFSWWIKKLNRIIETNPYHWSPLVGHGIGAQNYKNIFPKDWFDTLEEIQFDGYPLLAFKDTHAYLTMEFGSDYMTPKKWSHEIKVYKQDEQ